MGALVASAALAVGLIAGSNSTADQEAPASVKRAPSPSRMLSDQELAGQRTIAGFSGTRAPRSLKRAIRTGRIGGVVLFSENLGSRQKVRRLTRGLQAIRRPAGLRRTPLLIMTDQEGGLVKRLAGAPQVSAATMGARGAAYARKQGKKTGRNLKNAGINVDLAPVLDVARPGGTISDTGRGFGDSAKRVKKTAIPFARGLQSTGTAATAKHFPGLGSVRLNTDDAVQKIRRSRKALRRVDEAPYRPYAEKGGDLVMVGTAIYPAFDRKPAAFSKRIVTGELRHRLGFKGVTITDSLEATAAQAFGGSRKLSVVAARAGMDLMLFTAWSSAMQGQTSLARKIHHGSLDRRDFRRSVDRILKLRQSLGR